MSTTQTEIETRIKASLHDAEVIVTDTGGGDHFSLDVISSAFRGKSLVEQHKMVYQALGNLFEGPVHAVVINTKLPG